MKLHSVFCIVPSHEAANQMVQQLRDSYFFKSDISVLFQDPSTRRRARTENSNSVLGGPLGWVADVGALPIPGVGQFIAGGPVKEAIQKTENASGTNRIADGLVTLGLPVTEAEQFALNIKAGQIFLAIHPYAPTEVARAEDIISAAHGRNVYTTNHPPVTSPLDSYCYVTV